MTSLRPLIGTDAETIVETAMAEETNTLSNSLIFADENQRDPEFGLGKGPALILHTPFHKNSSEKVNENVRLEENKNENIDHQKDKAFPDLKGRVDTIESAVLVHIQGNGELDPTLEITPRLSPPSILTLTQ